ncbi:bacteriocin [Dyadobacter sp. CY261]|uniref:bacteriocin n=1 Tax=Dyadobacter sp. CY261 TaxID=2907203 RepID=UPI001F2C824E|nr:bacteriocin [Dyadobacter sp. CY261]MCF0072255.1 bacteriocin [Dyadobacter sp. CY261]
MKKSIEYFKDQELLDGVDIGFEVISNSELENVKGGDKEYNAPVYEKRPRNVWQQASLILDQIR